MEPKFSSGASLKQVVGNYNFRVYFIQVIILWVKLLLH